MTNFPDLSNYGYKITEELGNVGHRWKTYLAEVLPKASVLGTKDIKIGDKVVIKIFDFANIDQLESFKKAFQKEFDALVKLNDLGIPRIPLWLQKISANIELILVKFYISANKLEAKIYEPNFVRSIASSTLEILKEAQSKANFIHGDIKPENILFSTTNGITEAYLMDLETSRFGAGRAEGSSALVGTYGFIAPEVLRGEKLKSSDLYSLGVTLLCLLIGIPTLDAPTKAYKGNEVNVDLVKSKVSKNFLDWLKKMVAQDASQRFANAADALKALPENAVLVPEVKFLKNGEEFAPSKTVLEFKATDLGEKLTQQITLANSIPDTVLKGHWEVAPHPNDPPHTPDFHEWITFAPKHFKSNSNKVDCKIILDTGKLSAKSFGQRKVMLFSNTADCKHIFTITITTAPIPVHAKSLPLLKMLLVFFSSSLVPLGYVMTFYTYYVMTAFIESSGTSMKTFFQSALTSIWRAPWQ